LQWFVVGGSRPGARPRAPAGGRGITATATATATGAARHVYLMSNAYATGQILPVDGGGLIV
jgi:hypothetical protein